MTDRPVAWVAQSLEAHLEELANAARTFYEGRVPERETLRSLVTVHVASGHHHVGYVIDVVRNRDGSTLALQSVPRRGADVDVTIIPTSRIEALTFHAIEAPAAPIENAATSSLELKRRVRSLGEFVARRGLEVTIELGVGDIAVLGPLFESLRGAIEGVCADELGRSSLAQRVQRIRITTDASPEVSLANGTLVVSTTSRLAPDRLRRELDALL